MLSAPKPTVQLRPEWQPIQPPTVDDLVEEQEPEIEQPHQQIHLIEVAADQDEVEEEEGGDEGEEEEGGDEGEGAMQNLPNDQEGEDVMDHQGGDWDEEGVDEPPPPNIQPEDFDHPPWPPLPRQRLLGTAQCAVCTVGCPCIRFFWVFFWNLDSVLL